MIDIIIIALIIGYCIFLIVHKIKHSKDDNCNGICVGCTGCSSGTNLVEEYYKDKKENSNG